MINHENHAISDRKLSLEDQKIYNLCKKYGAEALEARRKFTGLLPEVLRRRIYKKKGFDSIFEFAAKLSGMSHKQVRLALNLEERLVDKPVLKNLLINGEVSINKLARVVSIATPENQENLAMTVKLLSKSALEVFVKDVKFARQESATFSNCDPCPENQNGSPQPLFEDKSLATETMNSGTSGTLPGQSGQSLNFQLNDEIIQQLNTLHAQGHDMNELLQELLKNRQEKIQETKKSISENIKPANSRHIPIKIKKILQQEYGQKCSISNCLKPAKNLHHQQRFAVSQNHDPHFLVPFCSEHHQIAHTVDINFHQLRMNSPLSNSP